MAQNGQKLVALTGSIASGKTLVTEYLRKLGYVVIDADEISRKLMTSDLEIKKQIANLFGTDNRTQIRKKVFEDPKLKKSLEKTLHPKILFEMNQEKTRNKTEKILFMTIPLLFELSLESQFDYVITVSAPEELILERLANRDPDSKEVHLKILRSQTSQKEKCRRSDFVIENIGSYGETFNKVDQILKKLKV